MSSPGRLPFPMVPASSVGRWYSLPSGPDVVRHQDEAVRYKLFNDELLYEVVKKRLVTQLTGAESCAPDPSVRLCLAAGNIASDSDREKLRLHSSKRGWLLFDEAWLLESLKTVSSTGYEDDVASVVSKLLTRR